jgi:hypothetical protein
VVDSAFTTALALEDLLDALRARRGDGAAAPTGRVATTGDPEAFRAVAQRLFGEQLPEVEAVDLAPAIAPRAD